MSDTNTKQTRRGETVERGTVQRGTVYFEDPTTGKIVHAGPGEECWLSSGELISMRARGTIVDSSNPGIVNPHSINGPSITFVDEAELGLVRQVTR